MQNNALTVENVSKSYKGGMRKDAVPALDDVSFDVGDGEIFGLIGPDGSGKTTMIRIATSLILADSGSVRVKGWDVRRDYRQIRNTIGYMPGRFSLYQDLTVEENLKFFAKIFGVRIEENIALIKDIYGQIEPFKDRLAGKLSGGMKQKLALCCALIHRPEILVLDEPTTGVDPVSRQELWDILIEMKKHGISILVSTPYMDEASRCDRISFIVNGKILKTDTPSGMVASFPKKIAHVKGDKMFDLLNVIRRSPQVESAFAFGDNNHAVIKGGSVEDLRAFLSGNGHPEARVEESDASLEDCFMNLNGEYAKH